MTGLQVTGMVNSFSTIISVALAIWFSGKKAVKPEIIAIIFIALPTALIHMLHIANYTITDCIRWMCENSTRYLLLSVLLCTSGTICGYIEGAIALHKYKKRNEIKHISYEQAIKIIKFGSDKEVIRGKGVCDLRWKSTLYNLISNSTGAMCHVAMLVVIKTLPDYVTFLKQTEWIDFFSLLAPVMVFPSLEQFRKLQNREYPDSVESEMDNPDNFYMSRGHVLLDSISLWFTFTMVLIFGFTFYAYSFANIRKHELSAFFVLPFLALMVFLFYLATSPLAITHKAISLNEYKVGRIIIAVIIVFTPLLYKPSLLFYSIILAFDVAMYIAWKCMIRIVKENTENDKNWESTTKWITLTPILMIFLVILAVIFQQCYGQAVL